MTTKEKEHTATESVGDTGAKRSSQMPGNPRGILRQIMDETPDFERPRDREQVVYGKMKAKINEGDRINLDRYPLLLAIFEYWFTNEYRNLTPRSKPDRDPSADDNKSSDDTASPAKAKATAAQREQAARQKAEDIAKMAETIKARARAMVRLDTVMPNGLPFRECTGEDVAGWSGDYAKIAAKMKPTDKVGEVFSDDDLKLIQQ